MTAHKVPSLDEAPDVSLTGAAHVALYRETNGDQGYWWNGVPTLLLTTTGRVSGEPRTIPIIFAAHGGGFVIIGSVGGSPKHPKWYLNLLEDPRATVQVRGDVYQCRARFAVSSEREALWQIAAAQWPRYDLYQQRTDRQIPVVVLERLS